MQNIEIAQNQDYLYLYNATHARFVIWGQQIEIMLDNYSFLNYLTGGFNNDLFSVGLYQVDGQELTTSTYNPHSSLLLLFFRNPLLFALTYFAYSFLIIKNYERKKAAIAIFLFLSLTMNSSLLVTGNPVFTLIMILLTFPEKIKHQSSLLIRKKYVIAT